MVIKPSVAYPQKRTKPNTRLHNSHQPEEHLILSPVDFVAPLCGIDSRRPFVRVYIAEQLLLLIGAPRILRASGIPVPRTSTATHVPVSTGYRNLELDASCTGARA